jgi:hypothetical protein
MDSVAKHSLACVMVTFLLAACGGSGSLSAGAAKLKEGDDANLGDCAFLQKVSGAGSDETSSKNAAREKAATLGATHLKWIIPCCTTVEAEAYRCETPLD